MQSQVADEVTREPRPDPIAAISMPHCLWSPPDARLEESISRRTALHCTDKRGAVWVGGEGKFLVLCGTKGPSGRGGAPPPHHPDIRERSRVTSSAMT